MSREHLVYGIHAVEHALQGPRRCFKLYVEQGRRDAGLQKLLELARKKNLRPLPMPGVQLNKIAAGGRHQGVVLVAEPPRLWHLDEVLAELPAGPKTVWLGLDEITDPHNVGAILRSASCLGADAVVLPERRTAPITPVVEKTASGAVDRVRIVDVVNLNQTILALKEKRFWVYGAAVEGKPLSEVEFQGPTLLLIGSEGEGLREKTRGHCDELVRIPQSPHGVESLNASAAAAILLYEISRQFAQG